MICLDLRRLHNRISCLCFAIAKFHKVIRQAGDNNRRKQCNGSRLLSVSCFRLLNMHQHHSKTISFLFPSCMAPSFPKFRVRVQNARRQCRTCNSPLSVTTVIQQSVKTVLNNIRLRLSHHGFAFVIVAMLLIVCLHFLVIS